MNENTRKNIGILAFAVGFAVSLAILVILSAFANNWWPMLSFIVYVLMALPFLLLSVDNNCVACNVQLTHSFGFCFTGLILSSLFGLPMVLYHADEVEEAYQFWGWIAGNCVLLLSLGIGTLSFDNDDMLGGPTV